MPIKLGPRKPKVTVETDVGPFEIFELLGSDLHELAGMHEDNASAADIGREVLRRTLERDGVPATRALIDSLSAADLAAVTAAAASSRAVTLADGGEPLERLGHAMTTELARMAPQMVALRAAISSMKGPNTLSKETLAKISQHTSAMEEAARALSNSGILSGLAGFATKPELKEEPIVPHFASRPLPPELARSPLVDGIAEANRLSKRNTEATLKSTELLGAVAAQTAVLAQELSALSTVFLNEAIPQWIKKADDDRKSARHAMWIAAIGLVLGPAVAVWQARQGGEDRQADIARQAVTEQLLRDQLEVARRSEERAAQEADALRRVLEAKSPSPSAGGSPSPAAAAAKAVVRSAP